MGFFDVVNLAGLIFVAVMIIPHVVFARTHQNVYSTKSIDNRGMVYIERIGKYCSAFLMAINIGVLEKGFTSPLMQKFWLISTSVMVAIYLVLWVIFFKTSSKAVAYLLTILAGIIVIISGLLQVKTLLLTAGVVYLIGELYVAKKLFNVE